MKIVRCLAIIGFLILTANIVLADGVGDPKFQTIGGGHSIILTSPTDPAFQFTYAIGDTTVGCGAFDGAISDDQCILVDFINNSGTTWKAITFTITNATGDIGQGSFDVLHDSSDPYFTTSASSFNDSGQAVLSFFGTDGTHPGILPATSCVNNVCTGPSFGELGPPMYDFGILVDVQDALSGQGSFTATGVATPVPEPNSMLLMVAGAALLGLFLSKRPA